MKVTTVQIVELQLLKRKLKIKKEKHLTRSFQN